MSNSAKEITTKNAFSGCMSYFIPNLALSLASNFSSSVYF